MALRMPRSWRLSFSECASEAIDHNHVMIRVFALLLVFALLFQTHWAAAASYCGHETSPEAAKHFGHHTHVHKTADGEKAPGGKFVVDADCVACHAAHPALASMPFVYVSVDIPKAANFDQPCMSASAPPREPERPQWTRLA